MSDPEPLPPLKVHSRPGPRWRRWTIPGDISTVTDNDIEATAKGLASIVVAARERATRARVVLVDYLTVVTEHTPTGTSAVFKDQELPIFLRSQAALAQSYRIAADRSGAELLAASTISIDYGLGSDEPWVFGF